MIFYKVNRFDLSKVTPVECSKETNDFVVIDGRRRLKHSGYERYFLSEIEAWNYLIESNSTCYEWYKNEMDKYSSALSVCKITVEKLEKS